MASTSSVGGSNLVLVSFVPRGKGFGVLVSLFVVYSAVVGVEGWVWKGCWATSRLSLWCDVKG